MRPLYAGLFVYARVEMQIYTLLYSTSQTQPLLGFMGVQALPPQKKTKNGIRMGFGYSRLLMVFFLVLGIRWYSFTANDAVSMHK